MTKNLLAEEEPKELFWPHVTAFSNTLPAGKWEVLHGLPKALRALQACNHEIIIGDVHTIGFKDTEDGGFLPIFSFNNATGVVSQNRPVLEAFEILI